MLSATHVPLSSATKDELLQESGVYTIGAKVVVDIGVADVLRTVGVVDVDVEVLVLVVV